MNKPVKYLKKNGLYFFQAKEPRFYLCYAGRFDGEVVDVLWGEVPEIEGTVIHEFDTHYTIPITHCHLLALQL